MAKLLKVTLQVLHADSPPRSGGRIACNLQDLTRVWRGGHRDRESWLDTSAR
jgi:hypothetical protein